NLSERLRAPRGCGCDVLRSRRSPLTSDYWLSCVETSWNVALALVPIDRIAVKQTMTIKASITAYSTAVGPSSDLRKRCTFKARFFIASSDSRAVALFRSDRALMVVESQFRSRWLV